MEERMRYVERHDAYGLDAFDVCLVPDVVILTKFKVSDIEKYKGLSYPKNHLWMFCQKMDAYSHNDKFLIPCF